MTVTGHGKPERPFSARQPRRPSSYLPGSLPGRTGTVTGRLWLAGGAGESRTRRIMKREREKKGYAEEEGGAGRRDKEGSGAA
jgi:hypothetical protein